ncbi:hypothetical protein JWG39_02785 [Desulforhopalus vacuolatus]|uniref:hypothetical protein n=1 Tax=Desulforhopalus vacuolatus TaxID=40414 RepID=UPI00196481E9|nr:hypothetical protein [Desulforhopalus vacuolatus]MBM9518744.1 hypothetical protein [Desulforhopalus vacuolatus]
MNQYRRCFLLILLLFTFFMMEGCTSPYLTKGNAALNKSQYTRAYDNFQKVPGKPAKGSSLANGLAKSTTGIAQDEIKEADKLMKQGHAAGMPSAKSYYKQAISTLQSAARWYRESSRYNEIYDSGSSNDILQKIRELEKLENQYKFMVNRVEREYDLEQARSKLSHNDYMGAILMFQQALEKNWGDKPEKVGEVKHALIITRCQLIRENIKKQQWGKALSGIEQFSSEDNKINGDAIILIRNEYVQGRSLSIRRLMAKKDWRMAKNALEELQQEQFSKVGGHTIRMLENEMQEAYGSHLVQQGLSSFHKKDIEQATILFRQSLNYGNREAKKLLEQMKVYDALLNKALRYGRKKLEVQLSQNCDIITPEQACGLELLQSGPVTAKVPDKELDEWLDQKGITNEMIKSILQTELTPTYKFVESSNATIEGSYRIEIIDENQWKIDVEIVLQQDNMPLFKKKASVTTGQYRIYQGWGPFRKIDDNQESVLRAAITSMSKSLAKLFIPFGRCEDKVILDHASAYLEETIDRSSDRHDLVLLRRILVDRLH